MPGLDGQRAKARHQRDPGQSERHRLQPHRHAGPGPQRRGADHAVPRIEARHARRHVRRLVSVALVPVRRTGASLSRPKGPISRPCWPTKTCSRRATIPSAFKWSGPRNVVGLRSDHHGRHSRSQRQAGAEIRAAGVLGRRCRSTDRRASIVSWQPFKRARAAAGGDIEFYVADPSEMPKVEAEVVLWGDDPGLAEWLAANGIKTRPFTHRRSQTAREVILVGNRPAPGGAKAFRELARHIARGSHVGVPLLRCVQEGRQQPDLLVAVGEQRRTRSACTSGSITRTIGPRTIRSLTDCRPAAFSIPRSIARLSPTSALPGRMCPRKWWPARLTPHVDTVPALTLGIYKLGEGRFTINTLRIRENLGSDPVAERLLRNMLRYAARDTSQTAGRSAARFRLATEGVWVLT